MADFARSFKRKPLPASSSNDTPLLSFPVAEEISASVTSQSPSTTSVDKPKPSSHINAAESIDGNQRHVEEINWLGRKWSDWWINEMLSSLLSLVSLAAVIVVLKMYDQKALHEWTARLSLNTYLAVFTSLAKAGLIFPAISCLGQLKWVWFARRDAPLSDFAKFEEAAQGQWAAARLIVKLKCWHLGSIGALVTILAVGISPKLWSIQVAVYLPFPRFLVNYRPVMSGVAVSAVNEINRRLVTSSHQNDRSALNDIGTLVTAMQKALYSGFWASNEDVINDLAPSCPTGNCTYPEYNTLAVCHKTANVTDKLKITKTASTGPYLNNATLPNGNYLQYGIDVTQINSTSRIVMDNSTVGMQIAAFDVIYQTDGESLSFNSTFNALEVVFWFCVNTYKTEVLNGVPSTNVTRTSNKATQPDLDGFAYFDWTFRTDGDPSNYTINNPSWLVLRNLMASKFHGAYQGAVPGGYGNSPDSDIALIMHPIVRANTSALVMEGFTNYTRNIANSLTNAVRTHQGYTGALNSTFIQGTPFTSETFIHVRWAWLSLLIGLAALSLVFLLATIVETNLANVEAMRSDPLAGVTILDAEAKTYMGAAAPQKWTASRAERLMVRLGRREGGWSLRPVGEGERGYRDT